MWRRIFNLAMVCVCSICMLPLAAPTIHQGKGLISCLGCTQGGEGGGGGGNPANDLVARVNADRASAKLPTLRNSKGLGCMALQYISRCSSDKSGCAANRTLAPPCRPPETDITEVYAANCGVELPTVGVISGRILGCSADGVEFYIANATVFRGKEQALVGVGVVRGFWCLLLSSASPNSSFLLEDAGRAIAQTHTHGCFSDPDTLSCNISAAQTRRATAGSFALALLLLVLLMLFLLYSSLVE